MDTLDAPRIHIRQRIDRLRDAMREHQLAAWWVPSADPHLSEYLPERWQGRAWLSGFTGSVGTLIVTHDFAGVWVDARYWTQAELQLAGTGIELMKAASARSAEDIDWLATRMQPNDVVGADGAVLGLATARALQNALEARGARLRTDLDLLDATWTDRPALPAATIREHVARYAPVARATKLGHLRAAMREIGATHHFISTVDDIAWLFNLRGADVDYNPVFIAHALIEHDHATLFIAPGKVPDDVRNALLDDRVALAPYEAAAPSLAALPAGSALLIDPRRMTFAFRQAVAAQVRVLEKINPTVIGKSRKTAEEIAHVRRAMEHDGAALAEFFAWLEAALGRGERITELDIDTQVCEARSRQPGYVCPSFATIAGWNANGAMPHYRATPDSHAVIEGNGLLLIDSGGQYEFGTTDITRVVGVGAVTRDQQLDFTRVLKGMIALSTTRFPRGTRAPMLDAIARAPIWSAGIDYGHGTGHGVGYFLCVHEDPQRISPFVSPEPETAMEPGMITSNEPGIYRPGRWGIRIENLVLTVPDDVTEFGEFLRFETLTLCPIDTRCIAKELLSAHEIDWLNAYHATVRERLTPHTRGAARDWLHARTQPI
ncbi:MAG TPA: aminopeptidase P family protein [Burkholderiaceae bacterium]|nr:aminopeptidase P family protein [Burkholderiaceae bacterium]